MPASTLESIECYGLGGPHGETPPAMCGRLEEMCHPRVGCKGMVMTPQPRVSFFSPSFSTLTFWAKDTDLKGGEG